YSYPLVKVGKNIMRLPAILKVNVNRVGGQSQREIQLARQIVAAPGKATRGGLVPARIYEVDDDGEPVYGSLYPIFYCMFNPYSYSIKKSSSFVGKGLDENKNYALLGEKTKSKPRQLMLKELWLDTTELTAPHWTERDVSKYTDLLLEMAESTAAKYSPDFKTADTTKATPPKIAFRWGNFRFLGLLEKVKIKFTHFAHDGTPQRAKVSLMLKEFRHRRVYPPQNPSSGGDGRVERAWEIRAGDRLDSIAAQVYGDASQWRMLANFNDITNPLALQPGARLLIPALKKK
ncbi:MAG: LysM peptidoglycan-binding domain-containing protein, partial [Anaerolineales bacterium]|nr:LysM peptidoglycan-binding domain-containing protein [Anaerolineales bacterium]